MCDLNRNMVAWAAVNTWARETREWWAGLALLLILSRMRAFSRNSNRKRSLLCPDAPPGSKTRGEAGGGAGRRAQARRQRGEGAGATHSLTHAHTHARQQGRRP